MVPALKEKASSCRDAEGDQIRTRIWIHIQSRIWVRVTSDLALTRRTGEGLAGGEIGHELAHLQTHPRGQNTDPYTGPYLILTLLEAAAVAQQVAKPEMVDSYDSTARMEAG